MFKDQLKKTLSFVAKVRTLQFILTVQEACDKKCRLIKNHDLHKYEEFVKEWKQEQIEAAKEGQSPNKDDSSTNKISSTSCEDEEKSVQLAEEMVELALIDDLLERARNIRCRNKVSLNKVIEATKRENIKSSSTERKFTKTIPAETTKSLNISNSCNAQKTNLLIKPIVTPSYIKKSVPRSKSAGSTSRSKSASVPRSWSENVNKLENGLNYPLNNGGFAVCKSENGSSELSSSSGDKNRKTQKQTSIVSSRELKKISSELNVNANVQEGNNSVQLSVRLDPSQNSLHHNPFPTYKTYQEKLRQMSSSKSCFQLHQCQLWYPLLNAKNKAFLIDGHRFLNLSSFKEATKLIHKIQETMFWIDFLSFLGRETISKIVLDENDWDIIRFCSYVESIFHENLQRLPILDTN